MMASSCSLLPTKQIEVSAKPIERKIAHPVMPREIDLRDPYVDMSLSDKNITKNSLQRVEKEHGQVVFFAMTSSRLRTYGL